MESGRGAVAWADLASLRFPSPLIKPDVRFSRIRLSDWLRHTGMRLGVTGVLEEEHPQFAVHFLE